MGNKEKQIEFEKGWEEYQDKKKKDIEELAKAMKEAFYCKDFDQLASVLIKQGYRKVPNSAVVIPEKITVETSSEDIKKIAEYNDNIRKETAEKIFAEIDEYFDNKINKLLKIKKSNNTYENDGRLRDCCECREEVKELAKQFGVEIKE